MGNDSERGSVSILSVYLVAITILLFMIFLDREWANYILKMTDQVADLAAEGAVRNHEVEWWVEVRGVSYYHHFQRDCLEYDPEDSVAQADCIEWGPWYAELWTTFDIRNRALTTKQLTGEEWLQIVGCRNTGVQAQAGDFECHSRRLARNMVDYAWLNREFHFKFHDETVELAEEIFRANWEDRAAAQLTGMDVTVDSTPDQRLITVEAEIRVASLFKLWPAQQIRRSSVAMAILHRPLSGPD